ncbi:MAG: hypothetical protein H7Y12_14825 [Sphingobacteriaceae bacterium]|nr:hypothetical protein [Cytophagaceae bacterium]
MPKYQLVEAAAIEHHNEYFEIRFNDHRNSLFFTTNEENLETTADAIVADHAPGEMGYHVVPHRKE